MRKLFLIILLLGAFECRSMGNFGWATIFIEGSGCVMDTLGTLVTKFGTPLLDYAAEHGVPVLVWGGAGSGLIYIASKVFGKKQREIIKKLKPLINKYIDLHNELDICIAENKIKNLLPSKEQKKLQERVESIHQELDDLAKEKRNFSEEERKIFNAKIARKRGKAQAA